MHNLQVRENADAVIGLIERAARAGYNGVVLADYKFNVLDRVPAQYFDNVTRVRQAAAKHHIELIPTVFPIGYSAGLLAHDPNLAEGVAVKEAPFVVRGAEAVLAPDSPARLTNGDLEQVQGDRFTAHAHTASADEKPELWQIMTGAWPAYNDYQRNTSRDIPVVVFERGQ